MPSKKASLENLKKISPGKRGRPKGSKDKIPQEIKAKVLFVIDQLEKENKGLLDVAREDPAWFHANFTKALLPKDVHVEAEGEITITWQQKS